MKFDNLNCNLTCVLNYVSTEPLIKPYCADSTCNGSIVIDDSYCLCSTRSNYTMDYEMGKIKMERLKIECKAEDIINCITDVVIGKQKQTVVKWNDGVKTIVKCNDEDNFSPEIGVAMCIAKKMFGENYKSKINGLIKKYDNKRKEEIKKRQEEDRKKAKEKNK